MKPDFCPKAYCITDHKDCPECKYAFYKGEGIDSTGKLWRWEYRPQFGVDFVTKAGKRLKFQPRRKAERIGLRQPTKINPAWELFYKWKKEKGL